MRVLATRLGYADLDTLVQVPQDGSVVEFRLERDAVALPPLTVAAERRMTSRELHRTMFDREVVVGAVGMTQAEIKAVPTVGEPDVFRSLQAAAGIESKTVEFDGDEAAARARAWANNGPAEGRTGRDAGVLQAAVPEGVRGPAAHGPSGEEKAIPG